MKYKIFGVSVLVAAFAFIAVTGDTQAKLDLPEGTVFKGKSHKTLYYFSEDGKRYVFPNEKTFKSWYEDFSDVVEVEDDELGTIQLGGNVRYKPGVYLIKITTDPKVYAVSGNGRLRWVKTEKIAKALYGKNWSLLVDDVADSFFVNYAIDDPIEDDDEFDPAEEEDTIADIDANRRAAKRYIKRVKNHVRVCDNLQKQFNKLQDRLAERGIVIDGLGDRFLNACVNGSLIDDDDETDDDGVVKHGKARVCHKSDEGRRTITISKNAVKAHLRHGDKLGKCHDDDSDDDDDDDSDTIAPVISDKSADAGETTVTITWTTYEAGNSNVYYSTTTPVFNTDEWIYVKENALVTSHEIEIDDLSADTTYYYVVKSTDEAGNTGISDEMSFTTGEEVVEVDETAPIISELTITTGSTTSTIAWITDEAATSKVTFADSTLDTASTTDMISDSAFVISHSLELTDLATSTQYFFEVESTDEAGNTATSGEEDFTTGS